MSIACGNDSGVSVKLFYRRNVRAMRGITAYELNYVRIQVLVFNRLLIDVLFYGNYTLGNIHLLKVKHKGEFAVDLNKIK